MFRKLGLKLINLLLGKDVNTILISLGLAKEEYINRYNNPEHAGFKSEILKTSLKEIYELEDDFANMLGINNYHEVLKNKKYEEIMSK
jgi:hypothetical protein